MKFFDLTKEFLKRTAANPPSVEFTIAGWRFRAFWAWFGLWIGAFVDLPGKRVYFAALTFALRVSRVESERLKLPELMICPNCNGDGFTSGKFPFLDKCAVCGGGGKITEPTANVSFGWDWAAGDGDKTVITEKYNERLRQLSPEYFQKLFLGTWKKTDDEPPLDEPNNYPRCSFCDFDLTRGGHAPGCFYDNEK